MIINKNAIIQIDTREKPKAISNILRCFELSGIKYISSKLYVGDYTLVNNQSVVVDRKRNLSEVCSNVCQQHERFRNELVRAQEAGIKIYILVEHGKGIRCLEDVRKWVNPRLKVSPKAMTGKKLYKIMKTQQEKYGIEYVFCDKKQTGYMILKLLGVIKLKFLKNY